MIMGILPTLIFAMIYTVFDLSTSTYVLYFRHRLNANAY
jgi:hypothetical protein